MNEEKDRDEEQQASAFKVEDRRKFTSKGEPVERDAEQSAESVPPPRQKEARPAGQEATAQREAAAQSPAEGEDAVDFSSFALSLATSAMAYLGEVPDPATGQKVENVEGAKQMIDILSMLQQKTKGNLEKDEERLINSLLYELRMKYLSKARVIKL